MEELYNEIEELKQNDKVYYEYIKAFYNIEKVKEIMQEEDEYKIVEEFMKKEDD